MIDHDKLTDEQLDELERLEKGATKGPWTVYACDFSNEDPGMVCGLNGETFDASYDECHHTLSGVDANLIVTLRNAAPVLIAELRALRKLRDEVEPFLECLLDDGDATNVQRANAILARYYDKEPK